MMPKDYEGGKEGKRRQERDVESGGY